MLEMVRFTFYYHFRTYYVMCNLTLCTLPFSRLIFTYEAEKDILRLAANRLQDSFVGCDMLTRYHWRLAAGHVYTHGGQCPPTEPPESKEKRGVATGNDLNLEMQTNKVAKNNIYESNIKRDGKFGLENWDMEDL